MDKVNETTMFTILKSCYEKKRMVTIFAGNWEFEGEILSIFPSLVELRETVFDHKIYISIDSISVVRPWGVN